MKLAKVKIEYTCGTTIVERVMLDATTGEVHLPPRLDALMVQMDKVDCSPAFSLQYQGYVLPVSVLDGVFRVRVPETPARMGQRMLHAVAFPSKDQRQQNGRFLHTLAAASVGGAVGYAHSTPMWSAESAVGTAVLAVGGVVLWAMGFLCMKGD